MLVRIAHPPTLFRVCIDRTSPRRKAKAAHTIDLF
jgi:hypothetical protein